MVTAKGTGRVCKPGHLFQTRVFGFGKLQTWVFGFGFANGQRTGTILLLTDIKPVTLPDHRSFSGLFIISKLLFMHISVVCWMY